MLDRRRLQAIVLPDDGELDTALAVIPNVGGSPPAGDAPFLLVGVSAR